MNSTVNEITNSITGKSSLNDCSVEELRQIAGQYPYFSPAQFLFVKKLKEENSFLLREQKQKASLYFQDPVWLNYLLNETVAGDIKTTEVIDVKTTEVLEEVTTPTNTEMETPATFEEVVDQTNGKPEEFIQTDDQPAQDEMEVAVEITIPQFKFQPIDPSKTPATFEEVVDQTNGKPEEFIQTDDQPAQDEMEVAVEITIPQFKFQPIDPSKAAMTFEPYHTVDYFASQGIKPKEEDEKPKDRLSLQLKSFTEWLKVMKRLPVSEIAAAVSASDEKKVEQLAAVSINDREVVTEAMAEVWEKQGNHAKAAETYKKLSLLNPDKSSYFAAKIENLKTL